MLSFSFGLFVLAGLAGLAAMAWRDHRDAVAARARLLDPLLEQFSGGAVAVGEDGFPVLSGRLPDRRLVTVELIPDTLVVRRLPQLWLVVTLRERFDRPRLSIGALARATGAEFYSRVHDFAERIDLPGLAERELLVRGEAPVPGGDRDMVGRALAAVFADPCIKEIAATPRGVRIVRQVAEGERGSHLLLRQIRFLRTDLDSVLVGRVIDLADAFRAVLDGQSERPAKLSA